MITCALVSGLFTDGRTCGGAAVGSVHIESRGLTIEFAACEGHGARTVERIPILEPGARVEFRRYVTNDAG